MLSRDNLGAFIKALTEASRTYEPDDPELLVRFVELRPGIIASLSSNANHLLTGRRGVGKSTNLGYLKQTAEKAGTRVVFVDVQSHKKRYTPTFSSKLFWSFWRP